ncbi:pyocin knob domain-containing protein [Alistipes timonensis]
MINIKNIDGSLLYAAPVTKDAVFHHELMSSEYIELVFNEVTVIDIPIGAYVEYNGSRYTVTNPVTPDIIDGGYKYSIQFKADWMRWEGITYFYINEFSQKNETSWSMTATPDLFLQMIVENISRATGKTYTFSYDSSLTATKDLQFNNTTVLEALSMVADAFETEWWIEGTVIHLSRCEHGDALALTYGQNIGVPSVQRSSEYATRIYAFGSTRNITQDYQNSGTTNAFVEKRLTLPAGKYPNGYKDIKPNLSPGEIIEKTVIFDDIYPSSDFAISDVRVKVSVDSTTEVGKDENGNPIYASMPVYFFKIAGITFTDNLRIKGLELKVHFLTGHLQGREFELAYHKDTSEYEIIVNQDGAIKLPNETLLPQDNDVVVLFNIVMPDEYVTSAENRLEAALDDYIEKKLLSDNNTYSFKSNPVTFAENNTSVNVGRKITLNHGTGILQSRILSIEYPLEYPSKVDISVGESIPRGKISSVETEIVNASSTIEIIQAYNNVAQTVQNLYARTQNQITEGLAKLANMWILDQSKDTTPNKTNPDVWFVRSQHDVVGLKGISAYGLGSTSGSGASGSLGELVNVGQWADEVPTADRVMVQLAGATHWSAKPLADLVGLDTAALAQYLTANSYLKASDISSYLTWANLSGKPTVYPTSWANIADKPTVYPTTWTSVTGRPTKLSQFTDDVVAGNYLPKPTWDAVFEVVTVDGTPALKVKYDILGLKGITAYADGTLSGGFSGALVDLVDVAVTNLASGDILKYNGTHFVNVPVSSIAGASSWDQITGKPEYYPTRWADVSGAPTSLPASDVYPWAKAASKPTYTAAEVGAVALNGGGDVSGSINASAYLTANTLRSEAALYPTISFVKTNDNSESLLIVAGNNLYYRPVASDATNRLVYHSGNFTPSSKLDKSVWDEAFELKTVNGVRVISAKLDFLSVAGISAYATGPSSGGGGGGLDYDLLKQALTGAITPDGYPFTISASFLGAIDKTYLTGKLANTYANKVHTHLWADITDRPTSLPANGGNADTVDNLHASSFTRADQAPDVDLDTVNGQGIMACRANTTATAERHYPIQQAGTLFYGTTAYNSANQIYGSFNSNRWFVRGGGTSQTEKTAWAEIWTTVNFNPDDYLPKTTPNVNGGIIINGETTVGDRPYLKFHIPGVNYSQFVMDENGTVHLLNGSEQTPGTYKPLKAGPIFSNGNRVWDSGNFNPDSKLGVSSVAVEAKKMSYQGLMTAISGTTTFPAGLYLYGVYNNGYPVTYGNLLRVGGSGLGEMLFGWAGDASVGGLYYRSKRDVAATAWSSWCKLWTSANSNLSTVDWAAKNITAAGTVTATKLVLGGITIDVYNGALRVNGNLVATGGVASLATA